MPVNIDPGVSGGHGIHTRSDDFDDGFVIAVEAQAGQKRKTEAVCVKSHDLDLLTFADRIGKLLRLDSSDLGHHAELPWGNDGVRVREQ